MNKLLLCKAEPIFWGLMWILLALGLVSAILRLSRPAARFTAIAFSIVVLIARGQPPWVVALHRFLEVSTGIVVAILVTAVWREPVAKAA